MYDEILLKNPEDQGLVSANPDRRMPEYLWVADSLGQAPRAVPIKEVETMFGITFSESLWAPACFLSQTQTERQNRIAHLQGECRHDAFQLVNMGHLGYGLFAREPIKKGSFLFFYTGEFTSIGQSQGKDDSYAMLIRDELFGRDETPIDYDDPSSFSRERRNPGIINAAQIGNLARFAQHLPHKNDLHKEPSDFAIGDEFVMLNGSVLDSMATCAEIAITVEESCVEGKAVYTNFPVSLDGLNVVYAKAISDYEPGDMIGISYGFSYMASKQMQPELFTRSGQTVPYNQYYPCRLYLKISEGNESWQKMESQDVFRALILKQGLGNISYELLRAKTIEHLGEERYMGHISCFLQKNPKIVLDYRTSRFFAKQQNGNAGSWKHALYRGLSQYVGESQAPEKLLSRLSHFGFVNNGTKIDVDKSQYKTPSLTKF